MLGLADVRECRSSQMGSSARDAVQVLPLRMRTNDFGHRSPSFVVAGTRASAGALRYLWPEDYAQQMVWCWLKGAEPDRRCNRTMIEPTPELPDDTQLDNAELPARIRNVLTAAGLKTVGEVREISDETLLSFQDLGTASVAHLRETLGLPSSDGVRPL